MREKEIWNEIAVMFSQIQSCFLPQNTVARDLNKLPKFMTKIAHFFSKLHRGALQEVQLSYRVHDDDIFFIIASLVTTEL